jgi:hypothetical protein
MKSYLTIILIIFCSIIKGQDTLFVSNDTMFERQWKDCQFTGIISADTNIGMTKLMSQVRQWFSYSFVSAEAVLDNIDEIDGVLYGTGNIPMKSKYDGYVKFNIEVRFKDDRVKYTISNLYHEHADVLNTFGTPVEGYNASKVNYGSICQIQLPKKLSYGFMGRTDKHWQRMRDYTKRRIYILINSLKDTIDKKTIKSKDDW